MSSKIQIAILSLVLMVGGSGVPRIMAALENSPKVLYLAAQYKMLTGDTDAALRLFRRAESVVSSPSASGQNTTCSFETLPMITSAAYYTVPLPAQVR